MDAITALSIANGAKSLWDSINNNDAERQQQYSLELMKQQNAYNQAAMAQQQQYQKEMFEYTGPAHRVEQLKQAGLNPGLIYGMGNGGGGTTGAASALGTGLPSAPNMAAITANKTAQAGMALQLAKTQSEIKVNESIAAANQAQADLTSGAKTEQTKAETLNIIQSTELLAQQTGNEKLKQRGIDISNSFNQIELEIKEETKNADINRIVALSNEAGFQMKKTLYESSSAQSKAKVDQATIQTTIEQYNTNVKKTLSDIIVNYSEKPVNDAQAKAITEKVVQGWIEQSIQREGQMIDREKMINELKQTLMNNDAAMDRVHVQGYYEVLNNIIKGAFGITQKATPGTNYIIH